MYYHDYNQNQQMYNMQNYMHGYNSYYSDPPRSDVKQPVTLTWNVSAYAKIKNKIGTKLKRCCRGPKDDFDNPAAYAPDGTYTGVSTTKSILKDVSGIVRPGELCAIMGASGAGKTTLLNIVNFRKKRNLLVEGDVEINGEAASWDKITRLSGYVQQDDLFIATLTVKEHLTYIAMLRMGRDFSNDEKRQKVEDTLNDFNLVKSQDTIIGSKVIKGISGGEKRRLAFASEIITDPPLLFCDEPTSGLDSFMAESLIEKMSSLAKQGRTVISTIHQPSSQIFEKFTTLCILAEGRTAYLGPTAGAKEFYSRLGYITPPLYNPADFYIQTLAIDSNKREESLAKVKVFTDTFANSPQQAQISSEIATIKNNAIMNPPQDEQLAKYKSSYIAQFRWLFWRQLRSDLRNPISTKALLGQTIVIGIFLGLIFLQLTNNEIGVQNRVGVMFILLLQVNFGYIFAIVNSFPLELPLIYREIKNRYYSSTPYFFVKMLAEMPKYLIIPMILITIIYWMSALCNNFETYLKVTAILLMCCQAAIGVGVLVSIAAPNLNVALGVLMPILFPMLILGGFFLNNVSVPVYFLWIKYISWFYYTFEAINVQVWQTFDKIPCSKTSNANDTCPVTGCYKDGADVLSTFSMYPENMARDIGILFVLIAVPRILALIIFRIKVKRH